ncbi:MAG: hypothetical protein JW900_05835 [Anaerolineae bacterium]|nr:hypothetical protein [Anaerolineae bacterium]
MADKVTRLAKQGLWEEYRQTIKAKWKEYVLKEGKLKTGNTALDLEHDTLVMLANRLPIELLIEPELWQKAQAMADGDYMLKATIRKLLEMWVKGKVDPWGQ